MKPADSLLLVFLLLWIPAASSQAPRDLAKDRAAITDLEEQWLHSEHDAAVLDRILAPDFVHVVPFDHFLTKQEHIDWAVKHPEPKDRHTRFDKLNIRVYGDVAIVNGSVAASDASGKELDRTMFTDVFAYRDGRWQAVNAQENGVRPMPEAQH
jgi:ketosteroid isomerase-like protein